MQPSFIFPPDNDHPYFHSSDNLQYGCTIQSGTNVSYVGNDIQSISTQSIIFDSLFDFWLCGVVMCHYWFRFNAFNPSSCHISSDMTIHDDPAQVWNGPHCGEEKKKKKVPSDGDVPFWVHSSLNQGDLVCWMAHFLVGQVCWLWSQWMSVIHCGADESLPYCSHSSECIASDNPPRSSGTCIQPVTIYSARPFLPWITYRIRQRTSLMLPDLCLSEDTCTFGPN